MSNSTYLSDNYTGVAQFLFVNHQEEKIGLLLSFVPLFLNLKFFLKKKRVSVYDHHLARGSHRGF